MGGNRVKEENVRKILEIHERYTDDGSVRDDDTMSVYLVTLTYILDLIGLDSKIRGEVVDKVCKVYLDNLHQKEKYNEAIIAYIRI